MGGYVDDPGGPVRAAELRWLAWCRDVCRSLGATQPLTIGNYPSAAAVALTEPLSNVVSFHPYYTWNLNPDREPMADYAGFERHLDACVAIATAAGKDLLATETVWGARDDATHVAIMRYTLGSCASAASASRAAGCDYRGRRAGRAARAPLHRGRPCAPGTKPSTSSPSARLSRSSTAEAQVRRKVINRNGNSHQQTGLPGPQSCAARILNLGLTCRYWQRPDAVGGWLAGCYSRSPTC